MFKRSVIHLPYSPQLQPLVRLSGYANLLAAVLFTVQTVLLLMAVDLLTAASDGNWTLFLDQLAQNDTLYSWIKILFIALRVSYIPLVIGYAVAGWQINRPATALFLGFSAVAFPIILVSQLIQWSLVPLADDFVTASGATADAAVMLTKMIYTIGDYSDTFVNLVLFVGLNVTWTVIVGDADSPHPRLHFWWLIALIVLPFTQLGDSALFGVLNLLNAPLTAIFFVMMGGFVLRFRPKP